MIQDVWTVIWKEQKLFFGDRGSRARIILTLVVPLIAIAIVIPLQMGTDWLSSGFSLMASIAFPLIIAGTSIPQAFAGERERHTLATLLASRLPDRAILLGKLGVTVAYAWGLTFAVLLVSLITVNLRHWEGRILFFKTEIALAHFSVNPLMGLFVATLGILISMRSATVQGAQQALFGVLLIPLSLLQMVPMLLLSLVPNGRSLLTRILQAVGSPQVFLTVMGTWLLVDLALLWVVMTRFQRHRLGLD